MEIILLEKVANLGVLGDLVRVKNGYARNFLFPKQLATRATAKARKEFEERRKSLEEKAAERLAAAQAQAEKIQALQLSIGQKAGVDGRLFGSVTNHDIADALKKLGVTIEKSQIRLPSGPLKQIGEHPVQVTLHTDVSFELIVKVESLTT